MSDFKEIIQEIDQLERFSGRLIPFSLIGLVLILGSIGFTSYKLNQLNSQIETKNLELQEKKTELESTNTELTARRIQLEESRKELEEKRKVIIESQGKLEEIQDEIDRLSLSAAEKQPLDTIITQVDDNLHQSIYQTMKVDLFVCESTPQHQGAAQKFFNSDFANTAKWKVKTITQETNSRPGYQINKFLIRYNQDENQVAQQLRQDLKNTLGLNFELQLLNIYQSPNYVSVFFCAP